jgi:hypothetical protein
MNITKAKYYKEIPDGTENIGVLATIDNKALVVPLDPANSDYAEILRQVEAGELTIADAD